MKIVVLVVRVRIHRIPFYGAILRKFLIKRVFRLVYSESANSTRSREMLNIFIKFTHPLSIQKLMKSKIFAFKIKLTRNSPTQSCNKRN